jgi:hypothetical protein
MTGTLLILLRVLQKVTKPLIAYRLSLACLVSSRAKMPITYNFYAKMATHAKANPTADVLKACMSYANTTARTGYTCFALSCMTCCCCTKCGQASMTTGDLGSNWGNTIQSLYKDLTPIQVRSLFLSGMAVLDNIRHRLEVHINELERASEIDANQGNGTKYALTELKVGMINSALRSGDWMTRVIETIRSYIIDYNRPGTTLSVRDNITLSNPEFARLLACYGMFYPAGFAGKDYSLRINQMETQVIQKAIRDCLATMTV